MLALLVIKVYNILIMSLSIAIAAETPPPSAFTAGSMYMQSVVDDLACYRNAPESDFQDEFFRTSLLLAHLWKQTRDAEAGKRPEGGAGDADMQTVLGTIYNLPRDTTSDIFYRNTLLGAYVLVGERQQEVDIQLKADMYTHAVERALDLRDIVHENRYEDRDERLTRLLQQGCVNALLVRQGFAMPAMPHQLKNRLEHPHSGVLLRQGNNTLHSTQRFDVIPGCAGLSAGHDGSLEPYKGNYFKRTRLLSACCDLQFAGGSMDDILDMLESDIANDTVLSEPEQEILATVSEDLADKLINDEARKGTRPTLRQANADRFLPQNQQRDELATNG
jgi:hypothetical protein